MKNDYLKSIEKLANGYEYEEIQTLIEETSSGTKKKIIKTKKHVPPNLNAIKYMMKKKDSEYIEEDIPKEKTEAFKKEVF